MRPSWRWTKEANKVAASAQAIKDDCQKDLDEAMPAYEAAVKSLQTLDKKTSRR